MLKRVQIAKKKKKKEKLCIERFGNKLAMFLLNK